MGRALKRTLIGMVLLSCASCGQQAKPREVVGGHVFYKAAVLSGGTIVFTPDTELGGNGPMAVAEIKADGSYSLQTGNEPGAASGQYRVTIAPAAAGMVKSSVALPQMYSDPEKSGLKREVKPGEMNVIDFHLD